MPAHLPSTEPSTANFPSGPEPTQPGSARREEIVNTLTSYKREAEEARVGGPNPRDAKWEQNLNLYWNRFDFGDKADWQAQETMPEVPAYVDRFAAALKEALSTSDFYTVSDPYDTEGDLANAVKKMNDVWLSEAGRNQNGHILGFPAVFEEQMKLGALMATSAVVLWKGDTENGRVAVETVDPRQVYLDPSYRNLYRVRSTEVDLYDVVKMSEETSGKGKPLYNLGEVSNLLSAELDARREREELAGHGSGAPARDTVVLDEYIATVVGRDGKIIADKALMVLANGNYLIRGPEANPFWHERDWLVYAPLVTAPLSVYGRSYMEDFGSVASTFVHLTNLILDAVQMTSIKAYALVPGMLLNPEQAATGMSPNKVFLLDDNYRADQFASEIDLGQLPEGAIRIWSAMKSELSEAAGQNEIGLGQFAPNSRTSATEVMETQSNSSAIIRSVAHTVETRFLDPMLDLIWKTGVQHMRRDDRRMQAAVGERLYRELVRRKKELIQRPYTFQARGISSLIQRSRMFQSLLQVLQVIAQNENLVAAFLERADMDKLINLLFSLNNIDISKIELSERDRMQQQVLGQLQQAGAGGQPSEAGRQQMQQVASAMGVAR